MLLFDEIPQPLTFYDQLEMQDRFKENHEKYLHDLLVQHDRLLPFQLRFPEGELLIALAVYDLEGNKIADLAISDVESVLVSEYNYYLWSADFVLRTLLGQSLQLDCRKKYYLVATTNYGEYYSEVFSAISDINRYLVLEWSNDKDVEPAYYGSGFRFRLITNTFITKGTPQIFVESEEDGHGQPVDISRKVTLTYDIDLGIIPNYLYEAVAFMAINNDVTVLTAGGLREGNIKNITVEDDQIEAAPYWDVTINFEQRRYYYNTACGNEIKPPVSDEVIIDQGGSRYEYDTYIDTSI